MLLAFVAGWSLAWRHKRTCPKKDDDTTLRFIRAWLMAGRGKIIKVEAVAMNVGVPRSTAYRIARSFERDFARFSKGMERHGLPRRAWLLGVNLPSPDPEPDEL